MATTRIFEQKIKSYIKKVQLDTDAALQGVVRELLTIYKRRSPIDTSAYRANWKVSIKIPDKRYNLKDRVDAPLGSIPTQSELASQEPEIQKIRWGDRVFVTNSVPYAKYLEGYGGNPPRSSFAPSGIWRPGYAELLQKLPEVLQRYIKR